MRYVLLTFCAAASMILPAAAEDGGDEVSTSTVYACADIETDSERLACYDAAVGRLKEAEETGEVVTVTRKEVEEVQRESFGFNLPSLPKLAMPSFGGGDGDDGELKEVTVPVSRVSRAADGGFLVYLDNGQVWKQIDNKSVYYSRKLGVETATIKSAAFGSYMMKFDDGVLFRVKRVE